MKAFCDKAVPLCKKVECTFLMINQLRENIGNPYKPYKIPCGTAIAHACSQILWFTKGSLLDEKYKEVSSGYANPSGNLVSVKVEKNKVTKNDRRLQTYTLNYSTGVDEIKDTLDLAIMLGTDEATIANEIAQMEKEGVICGYHTLIDWDKTSSEKVTALIEVKVTPQRGLGFDMIAERIYNYPEVDCVYLISGGFDFMVMIEGKTMRGVAQFVSEKLSTQESVLSTATHFILKKYKDHGSVMVNPTKDERMLVTP